MMRPVSVAIPPNKPDGLGLRGHRKRQQHQADVDVERQLDQRDIVPRAADGRERARGSHGHVASPLDVSQRQRRAPYVDTTYRRTMSAQYRVVAQNTVGYTGSGGAFMTTTTEATVGRQDRHPDAHQPGRHAAGRPPGQPDLDRQRHQRDRVLGAAVGQRRTIRRDRPSAGSREHRRRHVRRHRGHTREHLRLSRRGNDGHRIVSVLEHGHRDRGRAGGATNVVATNGANQGSQRRVVLTWTDAANNETGFTLQRARDAGFTVGLSTNTVGANVLTYTWSRLTRNTDYFFRIRANNALGSSAWVMARHRRSTRTPNTPQPGAGL